MRHSWNQIHKHKWICRKCGCTKLLIPNPYAREWVTEFSMKNKDGEYYGKTPPCPGKVP